jgi:oligoribonuclease
MRRAALNNRRMQTPHGPRLVWFDTEYTSLELDQAQLVQVAMVVTDFEGRRIAPAAQDLVTPVRLPAEAPVSTFLLRECPALVTAARDAETPTVDLVDALLAARLDELLGPPAAKVKDRPILAGNTIHADWWLAEKFLPRFSARLHYRHLDISALKILWLGAQAGPEFDKADAALMRANLPGWDLPGAAQRHDALYDVKCSIAELNFYRKHFLRAGHVTE